MIQDRTYGKLNRYPCFYFKNFFHKKFVIEWKDNEKSLMFDDEALEEKSCFTNNGKIKYTLMTLIINWCIKK